MLLPVMIITVYFLRSNYREEFMRAGAKRLLLFLLTVGLLYCWMFFTVIRHRQDNFWQGLVQSSFFVYIFMVLTLTGYFILFREVTYSDWWQRMTTRVARRDHVNLEFFKIFKIYRLTDKQILGNFVMLFPLGLYLPLMYKKLDNFFVVIIVCILFAIVIELLQLATRIRSADVDDVLLNSSGAVLGYIFYRLLLAGAQKPAAKQKGEMAMNLRSKA